MRSTTRATVTAPHTMASAVIIEHHLDSVLEAGRLPGDPPHKSARCMPDPYRHYRPGIRVEFQVFSEFTDNRWLRPSCLVWHLRRGKTNGISGQVCIIRLISKET